MLNVVSLRENPSILPQAIQYIASKWANEDSLPVYVDCLTHAIDAPTPLPQWYLLFEDQRIIGCAGLITNDFISRMELYPWICALYIEEDRRGHNFGMILIHKAINDAQASGFRNVYLCTDHQGYYERFGFAYHGDGYHPWGETSRVYAYSTHHQVFV